MATLSLSDAQRIVAGSCEKAAEIGISVSVVVLDANGHTKQVSRMDGAGWFTPKMAFGKAYAAAAFRSDSAELAERFSVPSKLLFAGAFAVLSDGNMALAPGAVPIKDGDEIVGVVAVSGGKPEQDVVCALAGRDRWRDAGR